MGFVRPLSSNPRALSSLFPKTPSNISLITKPKPVTTKKPSLYSLFITNPSNLSNPSKPSTNSKLPIKDSASNPTHLSDSKISSTNGKLQRKDRTAMAEKESSMELSPEAKMLVCRLMEDGYLNNATFCRNWEAFEVQKIPTNLHFRNFLKRAAEKFGRDYQEVAK